MPSSGGGAPSRDSSSPISCQERRDSNGSQSSLVLKTRTSSITSQPICPADLQRSLDPQIQIELERLNQTSYNINHIENQLETTRSEFRAVLSNSSQQLEQCSKRLGVCVSKARPYYISKHDARQSQKRAQEATIRYERAVSCHDAAREMVCLAEQNMRNCPEDLAWHQMLNHATNRVNEAEIERELISEEVSLCTKKAITTQVSVQKLYKELKSSIHASREYFELKQGMSERIDRLQRKAKNYENQLADAKIAYKTALKSLEHISERIHEARQAVQQRKVPIGGEKVPVIVEEKGVPDGQDSVTRATEGRKAVFERRGSAALEEFPTDLEESQSVLEIALAKHLEARNRKITSNSQRHSSTETTHSVVTCGAEISGDNNSEIIYEDLARKDYVDDIDGVSVSAVASLPRQKMATVSSSQTANTLAPPPSSHSAHRGSVGSLNLDLKKEKVLDDALACMEIEQKTGSRRKTVTREISGSVSGAIPKFIVKNTRKSGDNSAAFEKNEANPVAPKKVPLTASSSNSTSVSGGQTSQGEPSVVSGRPTTMFSMLSVKDLGRK